VRFRKPTPEEHQVALLWGVVALSSIALRPFWLALAPFAPRCPFRVLTGIPCPTCGTTHAAVALLHGEFGLAFAANPLAAVAGVGFVVGGVIAPLWAALRRPVPELPTPLPVWLRAGIVGVLLTNWAYVIATAR
jgi:hypothetical protein